MFVASILTFQGGCCCSLVGGRVLRLANHIPRSGLEACRHAVALQWVFLGAFFFSKEIPYVGRPLLVERPKPVFFRLFFLPFRRRPPTPRILCRRPPRFLGIQNIFSSCRHAPTNNKSACKIGCRLPFRLLKM